jgi:hypothetical protein
VEERGSAGLYLELDHEYGRLHHGAYRPSLHARVSTVPDHYLTVEVSETGQRMVSEVQPSGRPRVIARGLAAEFQVLRLAQQLGPAAVKVLHREL